MSDLSMEINLNWRTGPAKEPAPQATTDSRPSMVPAPVNLYKNLQKRTWSLPFVAPRPATILPAQANHSVPDSLPAPSRLSEPQPAGETRTNTTALAQNLPSVPNSGARCDSHQAQPDNLKHTHPNGIHPGRPDSTAAAAPAKLTTKEGGSESLTVGRPDLANQGDTEKLSLNSIEAPRLKRKMPSWDPDSVMRPRPLAKPRVDTQPPTLQHQPPGSHDWEPLGQECNPPVSTAARFNPEDDPGDSHPDPFDDSGHMEEAQQDTAKQDPNPFISKKTLLKKQQAKPAVKRPKGKPKGSGIDASQLKDCFQSFLVKPKPPQAAPRGHEQEAPIDLTEDSPPPKRGVSYEDRATNARPSMAQKIFGKVVCPDQELPLSPNLDEQFGNDWQVKDTAEADPCRHHAAGPNREEGNSEPWWRKFPDFVPMSELANGVNPRTGAVVYIDYRKQFQEDNSTPKTTKRRSTAPKAAAKAGKKPAKRKGGWGGKASWFRKKAAK